MTFCLHSLHSYPLFPSETSKLVFWPNVIFLWRYFSSTTLSVFSSNHCFVLFRLSKFCKILTLGAVYLGKFTFLPFDKLNIWKEIKQCEWQWKPCHKEEKKNHSMQRCHIYCYVLVNHSFKQLKFLSVSIWTPGTFSQVTDENLLNLNCSTFLSIFFYTLYASQFLKQLINPSSELCRGGKQILWL